tara:strand:+ start:887 stop:1921 length:1035 start_codon:yes stop_codon:yes gene_type:complete
MEYAESLAQLKELWGKGCEFLGSKHAILGGAMTWVSERNLVSALSNAGGFGVIACGAMTPDQLAVEIAATQRLTDKPFGVNLITMHPDLKRLMKVCIDHNVGHVILAGGFPRSDAIKFIKNGGAKVMCFAPTLGMAKRLLKSGTDALIIEGAEAGGHIGPVATSILAQEILPKVKGVPVFIAGGIGRGDAMVTYLEMGASGCQLGTIFVCSEESIAHENYKQAFIRASARDAVPSVQLDPRFPVIPVRAIRNNATREFENIQRKVIKAFNEKKLDQQGAQLKIEKFWAGALRRGVLDGDIETGSLMAGQSVGMVTEIKPIAEIIQKLLFEALEILSSRNLKRQK